MLPDPREPLCLRFGEQNLHIPAAGFRPSALPAASSLCSPLPARPCASVSGSKIFTFPPPDFTLPRTRRPPLFAPRSPLGLVPPFRGAKSSHSRRRISPKPFENGLKLGAKETEDQGFAVVRAPSPRRPRVENSLKLGAKETEDQGFAVVCAPSPRRPRVENGLKLGAKETEEQGFAVVRAPSLRHPAAQAQRARNLTLPTVRRRLSPRMRKKHRAAKSLLGAFLSSLSIIPILLLPPAQS